MPRHNSFSSINQAGFLVVSSFDFKNRYPDLLVYVPVWVKGQKSLSSTPCCGSGMDWISSTSSGMKIPSMTEWFQRCVASSINISTFTLAMESMIEEVTLVGCFHGSHVFCQICTDLSFPTLHLQPLSSTSRPCKILVQGCYFTRIWRISLFILLQGCYLWRISLLFHAHVKYSSKVVISTLHLQNFYKIKDQ